MAKTKIEWCDFTLNPVVGCSKCSPGCKNCYAERIARRLANNPRTAEKYAGVVDKAGRWTGKVNQDPYIKFPRGGLNVFIASMGDIFHEKVSDKFLGSLFRIMDLDPNHHHRYLFLTKRVSRMCRVFNQYRFLFNGLSVWPGVSISNQEEADEKIPELLNAKADHYYISVEPMLGPVTVRPWLVSKFSPAHPGCLNINAFVRSHEKNRLDWVICGPENGIGRRPFDPAWAISLAAECKAAGVPFFYKGEGLDLPREFPWR